ncbi:DUF2490 domain-containing protein [Sphingobium mellinum]|uniref:DUF2490 domain-containing protein n=1 Tax=Sphingobium mellinum TaxID=1387166 RepID=UPI0030ECF2E7
MPRLPGLLIPCACLLAPALPARAGTTQDEQLWLNLTAMGRMSGDLIYFAEIQPRLGNGISQVDQTILRGAIGWKLSPKVSVYQGYAHITVGDADEERGFQQISWTIGNPWGGELSSRTRLEQRWRSNGGDLGWRLREMLRYERPLKADSQAINALVSLEGFAALNSTNWGARAGFDQLRSFVGAEIALMGKSTMEIGYLNQLADQRGGNSRVNHVASLSLFFRR